MSPIRTLVLPALLACAAGAAHGAEFTIDPVHSTAIFVVNHFKVSNFIGRFDSCNGTVTWDEADPAKSQVSYTIAADSVDTNFKQRDQHAMSSDFLDAKQFKEITFTGTGFKKTGDDTYEVTGTLTMHGVGKPLTVTVKKTGEGDDMQHHHRIGFWTTFTIKRSDFGMNFMQGPLGDSLDITLSTEGVQK